MQLLYKILGDTGVVYHLSAFIPYAVILVLACTAVKKRFGWVPAAVLVTMSSIMKEAVVHNVEARMYALEMCIRDRFMIAAAETVGGATNEWWQVVDIWSGKALAFNIVSPLVLWLLFEIEDCTDQAKHRALWRVLFLVCCACSLIAASLYMTVPVELALWGGLYLLRTRRWRDLRGFVACGIPLVICAVFVKI